MFFTIEPYATGPVDGLTVAPTYENLEGRSIQDKKQPASPHTLQTTEQIRADLTARDLERIEAELTELLIRVRTYTQRAKSKHLAVGRGRSGASGRKAVD